MRREQILAAGEIYHICNKSIAGYGIFKMPANAKRYLQTLDYYNNSNPRERFSVAKKKQSHTSSNLLFPKDSPLVKFLAYIIMPDHYHILTEVLLENTVSQYIGTVENSFTRFFNTEFKRKGPLWQSRFRAVRITSNEQLLHVSRYIHLNATTAGLVRKPENWEFSSYNDYVANSQMLQSFLPEISISSTDRYRQFCEDRIDYQKKLRSIKKLLLE